MDIDELAMTIQVQSSEEAKEVITLEEAVVVVFEKRRQNFSELLSSSFDTSLGRTVGHEIST